MVKKINRRSFLAILLGALFIGAREKKQIITVNGTIDSSNLGLSLIHEHFLVDFIGADEIDFKRWNRKDVIRKVLPFVKEAKKAGVKTIFDFTPAYLGRDAVLLKELSKQSGMQIVTNTGYYGALNNKHLPSHAFTETAEQLADRWIREFNAGIDGTDVKPGFMKISVDSNGKLSEIHQKLVRAAAITHLKTGLTICSHTGPGKTAFEQIEILKKFGVSPEAFVWVHAQNEKDKSFYIKAASLGTWVSLDGIGWGELDNYVDSLIMLKSKNLLNRVLISHDAGWYKPEDPEAEFKGYTNIFEELIPRLKKKGFSKKDFDQLLVKNPAEAFSIRIRKE